ncbi:type I secretion system permease/ATPase (plasmid) [Skermanella mucosa]|uniref:type I secretion system permease/ATPase n=1 Tax=Skermanella mucosa TaxID=1789672 RepID=UPI00192C60A2|nr:type I secretion system permease/ATPase [Skermanella mucosa]UEM24581.1 type I secretion system permease/ATPase [Skermanella mucosa]
MPRLSSNAPRQTSGNDLKQALSACRSAFLVVALFTLIINLLMLTSPIYMMQVYNRVLTTGRIETLLLLTGLAAAALLLLGALDTLRTAVTVRIGGWLNSRLGPVLLSASVRARLQGDPAGAQPLRDLAQIQNFIATQGLTVFFDAPWTPIFIGLIWILHPTLGMVAVGSACVLLVLSVANDLMTREPNKAASAAQIIANQRAEAAIRNAEVVRAMGMLPALTERWRDVNGKSLDATRRAAECGGVLVGLTKFLRFFVQIAILGIGAFLVLRAELTPGAMIATSILLGRALAPIELAMSAWRNFASSLIAFNRLRDRLKAFPAEPQRIRLPSPAGHIKFKDVTYYPVGSKTPVLQRVSFEAEPGEVIAVIGPSGGGKSTLCRLLVGIAVPQSGEVRLDNSLLGHWNADELGRHIGFLPQDVELFAGTVRENIARMEDADDESVLEAAKLAHAHEMIQRLPDGYETQIGDGGVRLSGGQRQRIGLARAIFGDPKLIVLDEPNANLDQSGEAALAAAVSELKERAGAIVIVGHRPSTLAQADKILLLKDGRVEIFGPRDEVLQRLRKAAGKDGTVPIHRPMAMPSDPGAGHRQAEHEPSRAMVVAADAEPPKIANPPRSMRETLS